MWRALETVKQNSGGWCPFWFVSLYEEGARWKTSLLWTPFYCDSWYRVSSPFLSPPLSSHYLLVVKRKNQSSLIFQLTLSPILMGLEYWNKADTKSLSTTPSLSKVVTTFRTDTRVSRLGDWQRQFSYLKYSLLELHNVADDIYLLILVKCDLVG